MVGDQLSKRQDRALHRAFESAVLTQFPNPERKDCPGIGTLRAIANKRISMRDPALAHVGQCSPCFEELVEFRRVVRRHKMILAWSPVVAAILVISVLAGYLAYTTNSSRYLPVQRVAAVVDLRNASSARAPQTKSSPARIEIPRGLVGLTVTLPTGSEPGRYAFGIRKRDQQFIVQGEGEATIERGTTELIIEIDTRSMAAGEYEFAWRISDSDWRYYSIVLR